MRFEMWNTTGNLQSLQYKNVRFWRWG